MSTQVQLVIVPDDADPEVIRTLTGGPLARLTSTVSIDDEMEVIHGAENLIIGDDTHEYPAQVRKRIDGPEPITDALIDMVGAVDAYYNDGERVTSPQELDEWLREHKGNEVFVLSA